METPGFKERTSGELAHLEIGEKIDNYFDIRLHRELYEGPCVSVFSCRPKQSLRVPYRPFSNSTGICEQGLNHVSVS